MKQLNLIVAASENDAIGYEGNIPWHLPADMKYFKATTTGHNVIMGRKTYDSIGRPLPGRRNMVVSRQPGLKIEGCEVFATLDEAIAAAEDGAFIMGGAQIYCQAWDKVTRVYLTRVHTIVSVFDAAIPPLSPHQWELVSQEFHPKDEKNSESLSFEIYERKL